MCHLTRFFGVIFSWEAGIQFAHFFNCFKWTDYTVIISTKAKNRFLNKTDMVYNVEC